jgi:hypothetical protein
MKQGLMLMVVAAFLVGLFFKKMMDGPSLTRPMPVKQVGDKHGLIDTLLFFFTPDITTKQ